MIIDSFDNAARYLAIHRRMERAFDFLANAPLASMTPGRYEIEGDEIFVTVMERELRRSDESPLEAHDTYIDIQLVIDGVEGYGWRDRGSCSLPRGKMDGDNDILFFDDAFHATVTLVAGQFAVFLPGDAHAPLIGEGRVKKCVVKVRV